MMALAELGGLRFGVYLVGGELGGERLVAAVGGVAVAELMVQGHRRSDQHLVGRACPQGLFDSPERVGEAGGPSAPGDQGFDEGISAVYPWKLIRQNVRRGSRRPNAWWTGAGHEYHLAQEAKGLVLAQMVEVEAVLVRIATAVSGIAEPTQEHRPARQRLIDKRTAGQLLNHIETELKDRGIKGDFGRQLNVLRKAIERRNKLAHSVLVEYYAEIDLPDGRVDIREEVYLENSECGPKELSDDLEDAFSATIAAIEILDYFDSDD